MVSQGGRKQQHTLRPSFSFFLSCPWQSSIQDWGEEVEEGAVYHVTLKRVQIQQAANKGARWLGVSSASEILNFGTVSLLFCEYHYYLAKVAPPIPFFSPLVLKRKLLMAKCLL